MGALLFGQLTDRFGRKKLFMATLMVYLVATVVTAFSFAPWFFFLCRFFTGAGIGGEYAAINSAIDELIPARVRGRVDLIINGSYWLGAALGALGAYVLLMDVFPVDVGWRLAFGLGAILGIGILLVRRHVPESPRWLFIHGQEEEAERIVDGIERDVHDETGEELEEPGSSITVRQRRTISIREVAATAFKTYPQRTALGLALFVGQAFIYNSVTFGLGTLLVEFYDVGDGRVPLYLALFAASNFLGPRAARAPVRHGRPQADDRRHLHRLGARARGADAAVHRRHARQVGLHGLPARHLLPRLRGSELRLPHRLGDLPDGDPGAGDRVLLRDRHRDRRGHRPVHLRQDDRDGEGVAGGDRVLHRRGGDGGRRPVRDPLRRQGREGRARGHRHAADGAGRRTGRAAGRGAGGEPDPSRRGRDLGAEASAARRGQARRYRLGPGRGGSSPGMAVSAPITEQELSREVARIERALADHGPTERRELARLVGARFWGPGRFPAALREAVLSGRAQRLDRTRFGPARRANGS